MANDKIAIFYRSSSKQSNLYYANGLAPNAIHTIAVLSRSGVIAEATPVAKVSEIEQRVAAGDVSHAIIEAVWLPIADLERLAIKYPAVNFIVRAHSKMGFLQVEPEAIPLTRAVMEMGRRLQNVIFASNNEEFAQALTEVYPGKCYYLPNLYDLESAPPRKRIDGPLRVCSFGATRLLKMHPSAALAALQLAKRLDRNLDFFINVDNTPGGDSVRRTIRELFKNMPGRRLVEISWQDAQAFRETIATMDLSIVLSATETFCLVAADSVASGVPLVASPAVSWLNGIHPDSDSTGEVAAVAELALRGDGFAAAQKRSLARFVAGAEIVWREFLDGSAR